MRVLVAGGAGFLGSHLVDRLVTDGNEVVVLDNLSTGTVRNLSESSDSTRLDIKVHDVTESIDLKVDQIYNLACPASPIQYQKNPIQTLKTSILGSLNLLEMSRRSGARIFQASTSEVYGDPVVSPQREDYFGNVNPIGARACYDEGKRASETLFFDYHRQHNVEVRVARIFNTYGPRMDLRDGRVVSNFIVQALTNTPITLFGDGSQTRSFCFVDDLVEGILLFMNSGVSSMGPINLGNDHEFTIRNLAELIIELTDSKSVIVNRDLPSDDPRRRRPDISKARIELGWTPKVQLVEGLSRTIDDFRGRIK